VTRQTTTIYNNGKDLHTATPHFMTMPMLC